MDTHPDPSLSAFLDVNSQDTAFQSRIVNSQAETVAVGVKPGRLQPVDSGSVEGRPLLVFWHSSSANIDTSICMPINLVIPHVASGGLGEKIGHSKAKLALECPIRQRLGQNYGGSARESNPPTPLLTRHNGFEDRKGHRAPSTPLLWTQSILPAFFPFCHRPASPRRDF